MRPRLCSWMFDEPEPPLLPQAIIRLCIVIALGVIGTGSLVMAADGSEAAAIDMANHQLLVAATYLAGGTLIAVVVLCVLMVVFLIRRSNDFHDLGGGFMETIGALRSLEKTITTHTETLNGVQDKVANAIAAAAETNRSCGERMKSIRETIELVAEIAKGGSGVHKAIDMTLTTEKQT